MVVKDKTKRISLEKAHKAISQIINYWYSEPIYIDNFIL
jgi:hypothetical protein